MRQKEKAEHVRDIEDRISYICIIAEEGAKWGKKILEEIKEEYFPNTRHQVIHLRRHMNQCKTKYIKRKPQISTSVLNF